MMMRGGCDCWHWCKRLAWRMRKRQPENQKRRLKIPKQIFRRRMFEFPVFQATFAGFG